MGLPFSVGVIAVGYAPAVLLRTAYATTGFYANGQELKIFTAWLLLVLAAQIAGKYTSQVVESLASYVKSMSSSGAGVEIADAYQVMAPLLMLPLVLFLNGTPMALNSISNFLAGMPVSYIMMSMSTFLWLSMFSAILVFKMSRLPLSLKPYAVDSSLGLKPFANASLRILFLYETVILLFFFYPIIVELRCSCGSSLELPNLIITGGVSVVGLALFLLPVFSLHSKLRVAKAENLEWIGSLYAEVIGELKETGTKGFDESTASKIAAIDKIQRDVRRIREWPYDMRMVVKVATAVLLPVVTPVIAILIVRLLGF